MVRLDFSLFPLFTRTLVDLTSVLLSVPLRVLKLSPGRVVYRDTIPKGPVGVMVLLSVLLPSLGWYVPQGLGSSRVPLKKGLSSSGVSFDPEGFSGLPSAEAEFGNEDRSAM